MLLAGAQEAAGEKFFLTPFLVMLKAI